MNNLNLTRTAAQKAAFKAANIAACKNNRQVITIDFEKPAKANHRQQWIDFKNETLGMIEAAKRERHFHLLPKLMQRLQNANTILATIN